MRIKYLILAILSISLNASGVIIKEIRKESGENVDQVLVFKKGKSIINRSPSFEGSWLNNKVIDRVVIWEHSSHFKVDRIIILDGNGKQVTTLDGYDKLFMCKFIDNKYICAFSWCLQKGAESTSVDVFDLNGEKVFTQKCVTSDFVEFTGNGNLIKISVPKPVMPF